MMIMRGVDFGNPMPMDGEIPPSPGLYMVCTESSGGIRVIGVYAAENIRESFMTNEYRDSWSDYEDSGLFLYVSVLDENIETLDAKCIDIIDTRFYTTPCSKIPGDDW